MLSLHCNLQSFYSRKYDIIKKKFTNFFMFKYLI